IVFATFWLAVFKAAWATMAPERALLMMDMLMALLFSQGRPVCPAHEAPGRRGVTESTFAAPARPGPGEATDAGSHRRCQRRVDPRAHRPRPCRRSPACLR